jgi:hypothetical protein
MITGISGTLRLMVNYYNKKLKAKGYSTQSLAACIFLHLKINEFHAFCLPITSHNIKFKLERLFLQIMYACSGQLII